MPTHNYKSYFKRYGITLNIFWTIIIGSLVTITINIHHADTIKGAENEARDYFRLNMFYRTWAAKMGGVYAPIDKIPPNIYLQVPNRDITTNDGRQLTLVNPAYMTRMVFESIVTSSPDPIINKITSIKPLNPINAPDKWEQQSLEAFERKECKERSEISNISGKPHLRLISMFVTDESCLKCHAHQGYQVGDVRGAITISVPLTKRFELQYESDKKIVGSYFFLWMLGSIGIAINSRGRSDDEERLKISEENWRSFAGLTSDYVHKCTRIAPDPFRIQWIGGSVGSISGYSADEILEKGCWLPLVHPDDRQTVASYLLSLAPGDVKEIEFQILTKNQDIRWIREKSRCEKGNSEGELVLFGAATDITDRRSMEESLRLTRVSVEAASDAIFWITPDARIVDVNAAACDSLGYTRDELLHLRVPDIDPQYNDDMWLQHFPELRKQGTLKFESEQLKKDGTVFPVEIAANYVSFGSEERNCAFVRDITGRKQIEEERQHMEMQLLHAQKLESLGVLAGGIAHDFNNILTSIVGNADLALMKINPASPAFDNLNRIESAAARAADLAKQMLAYSGKGRFVIENLDMNRLLEEMLHMLELSISKKAILRLNLMPNLPSVEADVTQMRQILMNLVINASEAIGDKSGIIAITTGCMDCDNNYLKNVWLVDNIIEGLYVYLEIADTGCGMDKDTLAKVFDPFFTTKFTGRGLGMSAVLGIVRGHKGAIKIYSEPGKGTTFKVLLPASSKPVEIFNLDSHTDDWKGGGTVLLVDDEETVRGIGKEMLQALGFSIITANDGREAVEIFKQNPDIAFVILDLTMPHMDGEQCFRELRQLKPDVKVVMSSGFSEFEVTQKFVGKGLAGFVQKPYKLSVLKEVIKNIYNTVKPPECYDSSAES